MNFLQINTSLTQKYSPLYFAKAKHGGLILFVKTAIGEKDCK